MHLALSGKLGSGKSTVCGLMNREYGFEVYSTGKIQRSIAEKMGITTLELNRRMAEDPGLDHEIDDAVTEISRARAGESILFDSRMAWHFAVNAFKVYMYVDPTVAAKRVMGDDRGSVERYACTEEARAQLSARSAEENRRYKEIYGVDNFDYRNYDLIIDSTSALPGELAALINQKFRLREKGVFLSPKCLFPTALPEGDESEKIFICTDGTYNYITRGHAAFAALKSEKLVEAALETDENNIAAAFANAKRGGKKLLGYYRDIIGAEYESTPEIYIRRTTRK